MRPAERSTKILTALAAVLCLLCLTPGVASAAFTRPVLPPIAETAPGHPLDPGGVGVDGEGDLWVGDLAGNNLAEFGPAYAVPANAYMKTLEIKAATAPGSLALERAMPGNGDFYLTNPERYAGSFPVEAFSSEGVFQESGGAFKDPHVAVDDSTEPLLVDPSACSLSECTVYVSAEQEGVKKFDSQGKEEPFADSGDPATPYVSGSEITGRSAGLGCGELSKFTERDETSAALAVDPDGDIYVAVPGCNRVFEYYPSGEYVRAISLEESGGVPSVGSGSDQVAGLAVDALSGHLVVAVDGETEAHAPLGALDEFEVGTGRFVSQIAAAAGGVALQRPGEVAVDSRGDLYVVDQARHAVDVWGPGAYFPTVTLGPAARRTSGGAELTGSVNPAQRSNPAKAPLTECYFQYVEEAVYMQALAKKEEGGFPKANLKVRQAPCAQPDAAEVQKKYEEAEKAGKPEEAFAVQANIDGLLESGKTYRYRLVATTEEGAKNGGKSETAAAAFTAPHRPVVSATAAANLSATSAELRAQIDPLGADTSYRFEYDTRPYSGVEPHGTSVPVPDESIGAGGPTGSSEEAVLQHLGALTPGTTYYFRVLAENECEAVEHPGNECVAEETASSRGTFVTLPEATSSERGYELVTPAEKEGGSDMFAEPHFGEAFRNTEDVGTPALSGEGFLLETGSAFGQFPFADGEAYVFEREPASDRWGYTSLASPPLGVQAPVDGVIFDPADLSVVGVNDAVGAQVGEAGVRLENLVGVPGGGAGGDLYTAVHVDPAVHQVEAEGANTHFVGGSRNLGHVVLESKTVPGEVDKACQGAEALTRGDVLCEWAGGYEIAAGGERTPALKLVNVNGEGDPVSPCGASLGALGAPDTAGGAGYRAVSADGTTVLFTAPDPAVTTEHGKGGCWNGATTNAPQLYARIESSESGEVTRRTVEVSQPEAGVDDPSCPHAEEACHLATYVGASEDGSRVFFVTESELTAEAEQLKLHDPELYEWRAEGTEGAGGPCAQAAGCLTRVSAGETGAAGGVFMMLALSAEATAVYFTANGVLATNANGEGEHAAAGDCTHELTGACALYRYQAATASTPARTTFIATVAATTFGNGTVGDLITPDPYFTRAYTTPDGRFLLFENGGGIYRYDSASASLTFIAGGQFTRSAPEKPASGPVRAISDDGEYVFFDSSEPLVSAATNGSLNVYQWHAGQISLIGSGSDPGPSFFLGYSPYEYTPAGSKTPVRVEGGSVFIGTHAKLSTQDTNSVGNIYDARVCEPESPCIQPPSGETAQCEGGGLPRPRPPRRRTQPKPCSPPRLRSASRRRLQKPSQRRPPPAKKGMSRRR